MNSSFPRIEMLYSLNNFKFVEISRFRKRLENYTKLERKFRKYWRLGGPERYVDPNSPDRER